MKEGDNMKPTPIQQARLNQIRQHYGSTRFTAEYKKLFPTGNPDRITEVQAEKVILIHLAKVKKGDK